MGFSDLYYATRIGSTWSTESIVDGITNGTQGMATSIALTELGNPAVSFTRSLSAVKYTIRAAGAWGSPIDVSNAGGGFSSLIWRGTEASPAPQVAYNDGSANALKVASMMAGAFSSQNLDTTIAADAYCSMAQLDNYLGVAYIDGAKLGFWSSLNGGANWGLSPGTDIAPFSNTKAVICALALAPTTDTTNNSNTVSAHILYFDGTTSSYKYITNDTNTGVWTQPELVFQSALMTNISLPGCSIAVDSSGTIHAAFLDYGKKQLAYSKRTATGWSAAEFIEGAALGGAFCTIRLNAQGQPCIAYGALAFNAGSSTFEANGLRFAEFSSSPGSGPTPSGTLSFEITGKKKRVTAKSKLVVKGTASASATLIQWRVGKGKFRAKAVSGGSWSVKVAKLAIGTNLVQFRAVNAKGQLSPVKKIKIVRE